MIGPLASAECVRSVSWPLGFLKSWIFDLLFCSCGWQPHCLSVDTDIVASPVSTCQPPQALLWFITGVFYRRGWYHRKVQAALSPLLCTVSALSWFGSPYGQLPKPKPHCYSKYQFLSEELSWSDSSWLLVAHSLIFFFFKQYTGLTCSVFTCPHPSWVVPHRYEGELVTLWHFGPHCHSCEEQPFLSTLVTLREREILHSTLSLDIACLTNWPLFHFQ